MLDLVGWKESQTQEKEIKIETERNVEGSWSQNEQLHIN